MSTAKLKSAKTMKTGNKENCKPVRKSKLPQPVEDKEGKKIKAKPAPNFGKLHTKWNHKLQMGKACVKKPCTVSQEFNLTRPGSKFMTLDGKEVSEVGLCELTTDDRQFFTPDAKSTKDLELERELAASKQTGRATIATSRVNAEKSRNVHGERPLDCLTDRHPPAERSKLNTHSLAEEQRNAGVQFEADKTALNSILTNSGIENRPSNFTPNKQFPRSSIYYQPQNRVSLFDSCIKKRLLNAPTTPKTNSVDVKTPLQSTHKARRVPNPNFKPILSPSHCSDSVKSQEFNLTRHGSKFMTLDGKEVSEVGLCELTTDDRQFFTPDAKSMKDLELERELTPSKQTGRATLATSRINAEKSRNVHGERPLDCLTDRHPPAKRSKLNTYSLAEEQRNAGVQFEADKTALNSILTNSGIENRPSNFTPNKQFPRSSIYYQPQNRVSLFDSCIKKRLLNAPNEVKKIVESDRICISESPYVKGPVAKCPRNSVYPNFIMRKLLTPTTPKTNSVDVKAPLQSTNKARRVPNPNFKPILSPSHCSDSVKKIRKALRWGDILASPDCTLPSSTDKVVNDDVTTVSPTDQCPTVCETATKHVSVSSGNVSTACVGGVSLSSGVDLGVCPRESVPATAECELTGVCGAGASGRVGDDSSVKAGVSHPSLNNTGSSSSIGSGGNPPLPTTPACRSSTHIVSSSQASTSPASHTPCHDIASRQPQRSSSSSLLVQPGATAAGSLSGVGVNIVVAQPVPAMFDIVSTVATHPGDVSCQRQLQCLEEEERRLLREMQQLRMAMSDEHKKDDNDNGHHHHHDHQTHPQHETQLQQHHEHHHPQLHQQQHLPHHPDTTVDVIQHLNPTPSFSSQPSIPYQRMPHTMTTTISEQSDVRTTCDAYSSVTQGLELGVPSDINLNLTLPSTSQDPTPTSAASAAAHGLSQISEGTEVNQAQIEIQQQLLAVQQHQQELLRIQQDLERRLRESQMSRGPAAGLRVQSDQSERNNNTDDLKCNIQSIPPTTDPTWGPVQQACRQEESQIKSGDINDNYQPSCVTTSSAGATQLPVLDSPLMSSQVEGENTLSGANHAGRGQTTESDTASSSICWVHTGDSAPQSETTESHKSSTVVATEGQQQPLPFSSDTNTSDSVTGESVRRDSGAPLDLRTPCKLPRVEDELTSPDTSDSSRKSDSHVPGTFVAVDLSMPEPYRPSQAQTGVLSPDIIMPPIWTPLALKVAASRSSPKDDGSNVASTAKNISGDEDSTTPLSGHLSGSKSASVSDSRDSGSKSVSSTQGSNVQQGVESSGHVIPASVKLVTTCLTSVTLSDSPPLPAKHPRRSDTNIYLDALLDDECALFTCRLQTFFQDVSEQDRGMMDPVARTLLEGDEMHFVPIRDDTMAAPLDGSAFAAYSPV